MTDFAVKHGLACWICTQPLQEQDGPCEASTRTPAQAERHTEHEESRLVVCSAIRNRFGDIVYGPRHHHCWVVIHAMESRERWKELDQPLEQGFADQYGDFHTREEALILALRHGQRARRCGGDAARLYSENLY